MTHSTALNSSSNQKKLFGLQCPEFKFKQRPEDNEEFGQKGKDLESLRPMK